MAVGSTCHGELFFVYDRTAMHGEDGQLEEAILYYYPEEEFTGGRQDSVETQHRIMQIMGVSQALIDLSGEMPTMVTLRKEQIALRHWEKFTLAMAAPLSESPSQLLKLLDKISELFVFFHGSIARVNLQAFEQDEFFRKLLTSIWSCYLPFVRRFGTSTASLFHPLPYIQLPKREGHLFLQASHILQSGQRLSNVLGGAILFDGKILCTQLEPCLTDHCLSLTFSPERSEDERPVDHPGIPLPTAIGDKIPSSVRILSIFVTPCQYQKLRRMSIGVCSGSICERSLSHSRSLSSSPSQSVSPGRRSLGNGRAVSPPSPLGSRSPSPWTTSMSRASIAGGAGGRRLMANWYSEGRGPPSAEHSRSTTPQSQVAPPTYRHSRTGHRQSSSSRSLSESLHDSPFIDASPSKSNLAPASSQSAAPTVDFTGLGWRPCPATRSHATTANIGAAIESLGIGSLSNDVASIPRTDTASIVDGAAAAGSMGLSLGSDVDIASVTLGSSSTTLADEFSLGVANASPNRAAITATQAASTPPDMARLLDGTGGNDNAHTTVNPLEASTPSRSGVRKSASSGDTLLGSPPSPVLNGSSTGPTDGTSSSLPITGSKPGSSSPPAPRVADVLKRNHRSGSLPLVGGSAPLSVPVSTMSRPISPHIGFRPALLAEGSTHSVLSHADSVTQPLQFKADDVNQTKVPTIGGQVSGSHLSSISYSKASSVNFGPLVDKVADLKRLNMYVQSHSATTMVLMAEAELQDDDITIMSLFKHSLSQLGDLEVNLKHVLEEELCISTHDHSTLTWDGFDATLTSVNIPTNTERGSRAELAESMHRAADAMHNTFSASATVTDITLKSNQGSVYGRHTFGRETYFQQRPRPGAMSWQGIEPTTKAFSLEQTAHSDLTTHANLLL